MGIPNWLRWVLAVVAGVWLVVFSVVVFAPRAEEASQSDGSDKQWCERFRDELDTREEGYTTEEFADLKEAFEESDSPELRQVAKFYLHDGSITNDAQLGEFSVLIYQGCLSQGVDITQ